MTDTSDENIARQRLKETEAEIQCVANTLKELCSRLTVEKEDFIRRFGPMYRCRICRDPHDDQSFAEGYEDLLVCSRCGEHAVTMSGDTPAHRNDDDGDNPVFINGVKCWRRYKHGGYITLFDEQGSDDIMDFYRKHALI